MIADSANKLRQNVQKVIVGKDDVINLALSAVLCEGHILFEDVPGIGKTTLARALSISLGCTFQRIQFTPDLLPSDVTGINWFNQKTQSFQYRPGPVMSQVVLGDEINRATPRTQSALLEAMQEKQVTVDGVTRETPRPFLVLATQNPIELEGTFPLPEAQLDRFLLCLQVGTNPTSLWSSGPAWGSRTGYVTGGSFEYDQRAAKDSYGGICTRLRARYYTRHASTSRN
jgi:MoxR-like ATPase